MAQKGKDPDDNLLISPEHLSGSHWYFAELLETVDLGVVILDTLDQKLAFQNPAAVKLIKHLSREPGYLAYRQLFLSGHNGNVTSGSSPIRGQILRHGSYCYGYTLYPMAGGFLCLFIQNITQKSLREEMARAVDRIENVDSIFFGVRKVFGRPVQSLVEQLADMEMRLGQFSADELRKALTAISGEVRKMQAALNSLKNFGITDTRGIHPVEMCSYSRQFLSLISGHLDRKGISLERVLPESSLFAKVDPTSLRDVLLAIFTNAVEALAERDDPRITFSLFETENVLHLEIEDNGRGVPQALARKVFQPFYSTKIGALGLGLTYAEKVLVGFNGMVELRSLPEVGTVVGITLPVSQKGE